MKTRNALDREGAFVTDIRFEVVIQASPTKVWEGLTSDIGKWWPSEFYCGAGKGPRKFVLDARPGGHMWEDHGNGDGLHWGTVVNVAAPARLEIQGSVSPSWGGPAIWFGVFELEASGRATKLRFAESSIGRVTEEGMREKEKGWRFLFDGVLRAYLEGTPPPAWQG